MAPPQLAQKQMPVSMVGPPTTWGGVTFDGERPLWFGEGTAPQREARSKMRR